MTNAKFDPAWPAYFHAKLQYVLFSFHRIEVQVLKKEYSVCKINKTNGMGRQKMYKKVQMFKTERDIYIHILSIL